MPKDGMSVVHFSSFCAGDRDDFTVVASREGQRGPESAGH